MMKRYLGLTEEEIQENESLWMEERDEPELETTQGQDLRAVGVTPAGLEQDIATGEELAGSEMGAQAGAPEAGGAPTTAPGTAGTAPAGAPPIPTI